MFRLNRRAFIRFIGGTAAWPLAASAQQHKMLRVGFVGVGRRWSLRESNDA